MINPKVLKAFMRGNNSILTLFLRLVGVVFIFLITLIFTNKYDSEIVGQFDFTRTYFLVFGSFCMLASDQAILFLIGKYNNTKESIIAIYKKILIFIFIIYVTVVIFNLILNFFDQIPVNEKTKEIVLKSNLVMFFYCVYLINTEIFRALKQTIFSELLRNIIKYLPVIIGFAFINYFDDASYILDFFIYGFFFISLFSSFFLIRTLKKQETIGEVQEYETTKEIIKYSIPITLSTVSLYLLSSIDIFMIKFLLGDKHVAYYSVAVKVVSIIAVSSNAIGLSVATDIAYSYNKGDFDTLSIIMRKISRLGFYFSLLISVALFIASDKILLVFGNEYLISTTTMYILLAGNLTMSISGNTFIYLLMTNKGMIMGKLLFVAVLINFGLNFLLIPTFGIEGAAIASIVSVVFWNFAGALYVYKVDKVNILFRM